MLKHVLVIPDGNRRYAKAKNIDAKVVYKFISDHITTQLVKYFLIDKNVKELSIFAISRNNVLKRKKESLEDIFHAQIELYNEWAKNKEFREAKIRFNFAGDRELLPKEYLNAMKNLEGATKQNNGPQCNLLAAYNGQWEIMKATEKMKGETLKNPEDFYKYLEIKTPIDLVIRTGYEKRFSTCPLYQTAYAEFVFTDYYYPDLDKEKLDNILMEYYSRDRRLGK